MCNPLFELLYSNQSLPPRTCRTRARAGRLGNSPGKWVYKRLYASQADVVEAAHRVGLPWYPCPNCGFWHLGHRPKKSA